MARIGRVFDSTRFSQTIRCMAHMGVAASFLSVLIVAGGCQQKEQAGPPPVPVVEVVKVVQQDVPIFSEWIGVLDGSINAVIRPQVTGYLVKQNLHIKHRVHGHASLAYVTHHTLMVRVVAPVCCQVKGHGKAFLSCGQVPAVESV